MFTSFVREQDRIPIDPSLDLTQLSAYFRSHSEKCTAHQLHCSEEHVSHMKDGLEILYAFFSC